MVTGVVPLHIKPPVPTFWTLKTFYVYSMGCGIQCTPVLSLAVVLELTTSITGVVYSRRCDMQHPG